MTLLFFFGLILAIFSLALSILGRILDLPGHPRPLKTMLAPTRERDLAKIKISLLSSSWVRFLALWRVSQGRFGRHLATLGALLGALGAVLGDSWALFGRSWPAIWRILALLGGLLVLLSSLGALWGRSRAALGLFLGALGALSGTLVALSGRSEGALGRYGALFGVLGFVLGPLGFMSMIFWIFLPVFFMYFGGFAFVCSLAGAVAWTLSHMLHHSPVMHAFLHMWETLFTSPLETPAHAAGILNCNTDLHHVFRLLGWIVLASTCKTFSYISRASRSLTKTGLC